MNIEEVIAKQEITELVGRYMRGLDRLDKGLLRSTFHDDAETDYGFFKGDADGFVAFADEALRSHLANHHMIGQVNIELAGDIAYGEVYFQAFHRIVENAKELDLFIAGRYVDRYEKRNGEWKIAFRSEINDWATEHPASDGFFARTPQTLRGARKPDDALYRVKDR